MKKEDKGEMPISVATTQCRNYRPFSLVRNKVEKHTDLVEIQEGDTVITQKRSFHHLDGINASAYSIKSQIHDGFAMKDAGISMPSKRSIVDQSTEFMNNFKKPVNNE